MELTLAKAHLEKVQSLETDLNFVMQIIAIEKTIEEIESTWDKDGSPNRITR